MIYLKELFKRKIITGHKVALKACITGRGHFEKCPLKEYLENFLK